MLAGRVWAPTDINFHIIHGAKYFTYLNGGGGLCWYDCVVSRTYNSARQLSAAASAYRSCAISDAFNCINVYICSVRVVDSWKMKIGSVIKDSWPLQSRTAESLEFCISIANGECNFSIKLCIVVCILGAKNQTYRRPKKKSNPVLQVFNGAGLAFLFLLF